MSKIKRKLANAEYVREGQTFPKMRKEYRLNEASEVLEEVGEVDIEEFINSFKEQALDNILERFLPTDETFEESQTLLSDIDILNESFIKAEEYREKFKLSEDMSTSDIFNEVKKRYTALTDVLEKNNLIKKSEVLENEKETSIEESKQGEL